ncbi:MAG TPA: hypothetical protein VGK33_11580 [Chloroflexota bacterium]
MRAPKAALVTPLTGPLARYGQVSAAALQLWAHMAEVELDVVDASPSAATAVRAALERTPDVVFGPYGRGSAAAAARTLEVPMWNHGGATDRLRWPRFAHVVIVPAPASTYFAGVVHAVRAADATLRTVAVLHSTTGFGREVARGALETARHIKITDGAQSPALLLSVHPRQQIGEQPVQHIQHIILCTGLQGAGERHQGGHAAVRGHALDRLSPHGAGGTRQQLEPTRRQPRHVEVADTKFEGGSETLQGIDQFGRGGLCWPLLQLVERRATTAGRYDEQMPESVALFLRW